MSAKSSSVDKGMARSMHAGRKAARPKIHHNSELPQDAEARNALAWLARGMPDDEIVYDDNAPRLTKEQLAQFEPASLVIRGRRR